ncbi:hypothetical protein HWQ46_03595 [Shewanella sp. D64]|uniref:hypothetical protein n=1 Tax=unclassified Shewanella TaxID=196818 RepID=UPI0022BA29AC|nr:MULTISPECIES: hypothetical protein [unclassified Shewanella]MEC4724630.1 hypothetical protein [Shewanella sp. D64]MEC4736593.1 hypothetical protein [Shewanella sp. E94]WBJ94733.1 hypothetical protein HWQ47_23235 [Shewanella sp. MTB7]
MTTHQRFLPLIFFSGLVLLTVLSNVWLHLINLFETVVAIATLFFGFYKYYQTLDFLNRVDVRAMINEMNVYTDPANGYTTLTVLFSNRGNQAVYLDSMFLRVKGRKFETEEAERIFNGDMTETIGIKLEPNDLTKLSYKITNAIHFFHIFKSTKSKVRCYLDIKIIDVNLNIYNESIYLGSLSKTDSLFEIGGIEMSNMMQIYSDPLSIRKNYSTLQNATSNRLKNNN